MNFSLFSRTTLQVFVTYLTGALYVHPLWFYKHQHDNRVHSKLFVACQLWWFQWQFWFVPSVPGYLREEEEHKPDPWHNPIERNHMGLHLENEVAVVNTPTIISNEPVLDGRNERPKYVVEVEWMHSVQNAVLAMTIYRGIKQKLLKMWKAQGAGALLLV